MHCSTPLAAYPKNLGVDESARRCAGLSPTPLLQHHPLTLLFQRRIVSIFVSDQGIVTAPPIPPQ